MDELVSGGLIALVAATVVVVGAVAVSRGLGEQGTSAVVATSTPPAVEEQVVRLHLGGADGGLDLDLVEDPLDAALTRADAGYWDGHEVGPDAAVLYFHGPSADRMAEVILPLVADLPVPAGSYLVKQYGQAGAREQRVALPRGG